MMYFRIDNKVAASVPVQADGTATYAISSLALGSHTIKASYGTAAGSRYDASSSDTQTLTVYGDGPDFKVSASANALSVARGSTSSPVTVSVASSNGAAGNVSFACSGLPMGVTCNFAPAQGTITDGGTMSTSMTVSTTSAAGLGLLGLLLLPMFGIGADRRRKVLAMSVLVGTVAVGAMTGCSGDKKYYEVPTGTVQVLVSATVGDSTRTVPISVTIQQ
jgi:phage baseplate assembly protein gpV